jgi:hypothetical protein
MGDWDFGGDGCYRLQGAKERGRERDGKLGLGGNGYHARREGEGVLGLGLRRKERFIF